MTAVTGAVIVVSLIGYGCFSIGRWVASKWLIVRAWRWFSGHAHHGKHVTNAGWIRKGYGPALTTTGHALWWWYLPRWQRALHRTGGTLAFFALVLAFLANRAATVKVMAVAVFLAFCGALAWFWLWLRHRKLRRTWLHPLHLATHQIAGIPRAQGAQSWIKAEVVKDAVHEVTLSLPAGWPPDENDKKRLVAIAAAKTGIENPKPTWRLGGPDPFLKLEHWPTAPSYVGFKEPRVLEEMAKCKPDEILLGFGQGDVPVRASFSTDSPHLAVSMGTGAGKSNLAGFILLQILLRGGIGLILDAKQGASYPWVLKEMDESLVQLPNVGYARTTRELHEGMEWLSEELKRRTEVAFYGMDTRGRVHSQVGPPLFIIVEELNYAEDPLRLYWTEGLGGKGRSPAFTGLGATAFAGRFVDMHLIIIGQMITAAVTGRRDSSVKENCGIKMLSRYGLKGWRVMCDDIPMPPPPEGTGRVQVVTGHKVRETQVPDISGDAAEMVREMVLASDMAALPSTMPRCLVTGVPVLAGSGLPPAPETVSAPLAVSRPRLLMVTLDEAVKSGELYPDTTVGALRMCRFRDRETFPAAVGKRGPALLYDLAALKKYDDWRRR